MTPTHNVELLQAAYKGWADSKGSRPDVWLDILSDDVRLVSMDDTAPGLAFAAARNSKEQVVEYFSSLLELWQMVDWTAETFVSEDDKVAVFGRCAWTNKATGKTARVRTAHLWRFRSGKVVEIHEVFDSARAAAAASF